MSLEQISKTPSDPAISSKINSTLTSNLESLSQGESTVVAK